jgi:hypothetical protein
MPLPDSTFEEPKNSDPQPPDVHWIVLFVLLTMLLVIVILPHWQVAGVIGTPVLWYVGLRAVKDLKSFRRYDSLAPEKPVDDDTSAFSVSDP